MNCRSCQSNIAPFFSLGDMPLVNSFLKEDEVSTEQQFDLTVGFCENCYLVQLLHTVAPEILFSHYLYFSSTSASFLEHCKATAQEITQRFKLSKTSLVMEIASNDGAQLQYFQQLNVSVIGVDPAKNIAKVANDKGIPTLAEFFNLEFARNYVKNAKQKPDIIFGANVLAHAPEIDDFLLGVKHILKSGGTAIFEFPYLKGLFENKFDTIYHEHVFYYSLIAIVNIFKHAGLQVYDVEQTPTQGGSLRIFASHPGSFEDSDRLHDLAKIEHDDGYDLLQTYQSIDKRVKKLKTKLISFLDSIKSEGKRMAAYSAPAKGNILLNYFGIGPQYLDFIVDRAEGKQGLYTPGTHLLVKPVSEVLQQQLDYLLVLCWNIADEVVEQLSEYKKRGGKFIIPIPKLKVL